MRDKCQRATCLPLPSGRRGQAGRIGYLRADAASYQAEILNYCEQKGIKYAIGAHIDRAVKEAILSIPVCRQAGKKMNGDHTKIDILPRQYIVWKRQIRHLG